MPKRRRPAKIPTPAWERPRGAIGQRILGRSFQLYGIVLAGLIVVVALGVIGFAYWSDYRADQQRPHSTAVRVEDTKFDLQYFSRRLKLFVDQNGGPGNQTADPRVALPAVAETLIQEEILRRFAGDLGVSASEEEIKAEIATQIGSTPDATDFDVVFQSALTRTGLTEEQYRQLVLAVLLSRKVREKLGEGLPAAAESVHYRQILVNDDAAAQEIKGQVEGGGDFAALARERSLDTNTKDSGGDAGWVPRGTLEPSQEELIFLLEPGQLTTIPLSQGGAVFVVQMLEKAADRPVDDAQKPALVQRAFRDWVQEKRQGLEIVNRMDLSSGDPDNLRWAVDHAYGQAAPAASGQSGG